MCVCLGTGELISFPSSSLRLPCKGRAGGWRGLADASKLALLEAWGEGHVNSRSPTAVHPPPGEEKKQKEGASKSFLPGSASSALPRTLSGGAQAASVPGTASAAPRHILAEAEGAGCGLGCPLPPACPGADSGTARPGWQWMGEHSPAPGEGAQRCRRHPSNSPRTPATCQCAPGLDGPRVAPGGEGRGLGRLGPRLAHQAPAPAPAQRAATSHPPSPPAGQARLGRALGLGAAHRPPPRPTRRPAFSSPPLSPATFRALFSGWK